MLIFVLEPWVILNIPWLSIAHISGRFLKQEQWERWRAKREICVQVQAPGGASAGSGGMVVWYGV